jgi:uncharacterized protein YlxW (UPF0749 family)
MKFSVDRDKNEWIWVVSALCLVLGMLLAAALKTQQNIRTNSNIPTTRVSGLVQALLDEKEMNKNLHARITDLLAKNNAYEKMVSEGTGATGRIGKQSLQYKFQAGLMPAEGAGVEVTLRDSPRRPPADADQFLMQDYIVHDQDLRGVVNELAANGAEVMCIKDKDGDQRIIANTGIRCVGGTIQVNSVPMSPPFTIVAIGPPNTLESALMMARGLIEQLRPETGLAKSMFSVKKSDHLVIPAYSGSVKYRYAQPAEMEEDSQ